MLGRGLNSPNVLELGRVAADDLAHRRALHFIARPIGAAIFGHYGDRIVSAKSVPLLQG
jgi:hypothetical protein